MIVLSSENREEMAGAEEEVKVDRNWEIGRHQGTEAGWKRSQNVAFLSFTATGESVPSVSTLLGQLTCFQLLLWPVIYLHYISKLRGNTSYFIQNGLFHNDIKDYVKHHYTVNMCVFQECFFFQVCVLCLKYVVSVFVFQVCGVCVCVWSMWCLCLCLKYVVCVFVFKVCGVCVCRRGSQFQFPRASCLQGWSRPDDEHHPRGRDDHIDDDDDDVQKKCSRFV